MINGNAQEMELDYPDCFQRIYDSSNGRKKRRPSQSEENREKKKCVEKATKDEKNVTFDGK